MINGRIGAFMLSFNWALVLTHTHTHTLVCVCVCVSIWSLHTHTHTLVGKSLWLQQVNYVFKKNPKKTMSYGAPRGSHIFELMYFLNQRDLFQP